MKKWLKDNKIIILSALVAFIIGLGFIIYYFGFKYPFVKKLDSKYYSFQYDSTWRIINKKKNMSVLRHNSGSKITIQIMELEDEYRYLSIDEIVDGLIYNIKKQNESYKLLFQGKDSITKYCFDGYKLLYENEDGQIMIYLYKKSDQLVSVKYEAKSNYFDILLDSVHAIIYNLNVKDIHFSLDQKKIIDNLKVQYSSNPKLDNKLKDTKSYEIAKNNYYVKYSVPTNFVLNSLDSTSGSFDFNMDDDRINLKVDIYKQNLYEYLDRNASLNVYKNYEIYHKEKDDNYSDFKESLSTFNSKYISYIYKNSYVYNKAIRYNKDNKKEEYKRKDETIELIYELDSNHILVIKIYSMGLSITEKLVNLIEINQFDNYASYIKIEKENQSLIGRLQRFSSKKDKIDAITIMIPDSYQEIDKNSNIFLKRYYGYHYREDMDIYDYEVHFELSPLRDDSIVKTINSLIRTKSSFGEFHELSYTSTLMIGDRQFRVYDGGYTDRSGFLFASKDKYYVYKKVILYNISNKGNLYIEIDGNGKEITSDIVNNLVHFKVEEKDY